MKELTTYIQEGFYSNTGGSLGKLIKEIPDKITDHLYLQEISRLRYSFDAESTKLYKELEEVFLGIPSFKTTYIYEYMSGRYGGVLVKETLRYEFIKRNADDCKMRRVVIAEDQPGKERVEAEETYTDTKDLLCKFIYYLRNRCRDARENLKRYGRTFTFEIY